MKPILCSLGIHKLTTAHWKHKERVRSNRKGGLINYKQMNFLRNFLACCWQLVN